MNISQTSYTIVDYCDAMVRKEIVVNREYQRSDGVWPNSARSFLIETILLGYPIPKLYLYQVTDLKSRKTTKQIVDGQQRSFTILDFYQDKFVISRTSELDDVKGKGFSQLPEEYQRKFIEYTLSVDLFISATNEEIREVFRRINSYTVPLNNEEKRHSRWQGEFKWYIYNLSKKYDQTFVNIGVFSDKQLIRMTDAKLFTEITYALLNGLKTTTGSSLDKLYKEYDNDFPHTNEFLKRFSSAFATLSNWEELHSTAIMRPHILYGLLLGIIHKEKTVETLQEVYKFSNREVKRNEIIVNLSRLAAAIDTPEDAPTRFQTFVEASAKTTNEASRRKTIFKWICRAIEEEKV